MSDWVKKKRGWSTIWTHPNSEYAIVDTNGFGLNPRISFKGQEFSSVKAAKKYADAIIEEARLSAAIRQRYIEDI